MNIEQLTNFLIESNKIEGITRDVTFEEMEATNNLLLLSMLRTCNLVDLVLVYQPDAILRSRPGLNVRVANHIAPPGGKEIANRLTDILVDAFNDAKSPFNLHRAYENLHPFTDGNGRSGRALWLWQMEHFQGGAPLGFLHTFYYQTLAASR